MNAGCVERLEDEVTELKGICKMLLIALELRKPKRHQHLAAMTDEQIVQAKIRHFEGKETLQSIANSMYVSRSTVKKWIYDNKYQIAYQNKRMCRAV